MTRDDILGLFFTKSYEKQINDMMLEDVDYDVDEYGVLNYVANLIDVPYSCFLEYIKNNPNRTIIQSRHITQSSSFEACEREMIDIFLEENNKGLDFISIGKHFTKYIRSDKDGAFRKYGENQVKTAEQLGLAFEYFNHWYLNCTGYIYNKLDSHDQKSLLSRNLLRDPLYNKIMRDLCEGDLDIIDYMTCLESNETKLRRYDSVMRLLSICIDECNKEHIKIGKVQDNKKQLDTLVKNDKLIKKTGLSPKSIKSEEVKMVADDTDVSTFYDSKTIDDYIQMFATLKCFVKNGRKAPYKALMLLSVINLIEKGVVKENRVYPSKELKEEFRHLSSIMKYDRDLFSPPFDLPFYHLSNEGFWHLISNDKNISTEKITKFSQIDSAIIDKALYNYIVAPSSRALLRYTLIGSYFD